ncbi:MAG: class GN sortase [bacterium]|nr:class GN sortase [bacterium]
MKRRSGFLIRLTALILLAGGLGLLGQELFLKAKGLLAERLIERAYAAHLEDGGRHRPWSWADHYPLGELAAPQQGVRRLVISGATGPSLAFAAGHVDGTALPDRPGNCVIAGHRDGAFGFLQDLKPGDVLELSCHGSLKQFTVSTIEVLDRTAIEVLESTTEDRLTLITCHPFAALTPGPERYVVRCVRRDPRFHQSKVRSAHSTASGNSTCDAH